MQYFRKIVGDRIYLSPRGASDEEIEKFTEWMNDFQVTDYINKSEQIMTAIGEKEWLENTARKNENKNFNIIDNRQCIDVMTTFMISPHLYIYFWIFSNI